VSRPKPPKATPTTSPGSTASRLPANAPAQPKLDLSKIRHDLRTPINHILGYCEMLQEEQSVPHSFQADLQKIHTGGRQLLVLINEYFDDETFETKHRDLHQLCHELRTPVNHIIGYSELLQEQAQDAGLKKHLPDLQKIHGAAQTWLALMEEYLIPPGNPSAPSGGLTVSAMSPPILDAGIRFQGPMPGALAALPEHGSLLVVDDDEINRDLLARRLRRHGYTVSLAANGLEALKLVRGQPFDLVLLDMIMPGIDGYQVLAKMKSDTTLRNLPVIMISALDQEQGVARCIEMGAEDYLSKPINPVFLRARIGACLEKKRLRDNERRTYQALLESQQKLAAELAEAASYISSLLPKPLAGKVHADWRFVPSEQLGGDVLSYHWLDDSHLACFVIDVCGHGLSAAFLSISVLNVLRSQALPGTDFKNPAAVLSGLNAKFPMEEHHNMYFTVWYGVYETTTRQLTYASAGHPPAILLSPASPRPAPPAQLRTAGVLIGYLVDSPYASARCEIPLGSRLFVFSDGAYEIQLPDGVTLQLNDLIEQLTLLEGGPGDLDQVLAWARSKGRNQKLDDDLSIIQLTFGE
jgi:sigma-B regulation protein RsbU (phosphoserine phosphatase)